MAYGTKYVNDMEGYAIHLDFKVRDGEGKYLNPITFMRCFVSSKTNIEGKPPKNNCDILFSVSKGLNFYCSFACDCKNVDEDGEACEIRDKNKIESPITYNF